MKPTMRISIFALLFVFASVSRVLALDLSGPNDDWAIEPKTPKQDLAGPSNDKEIHGWVSLGRRRGANGDPASYVEKKVKCGDDKDKWCTVTLVIGFYQDDQERLKITHTGSDGQKREAFLDSPTDTIHKKNPGTHEYTVSVKGCSQCTIRVEIVESAKSKKANTQSFAHAKIATLRCTEKDQTNIENRLLKKGRTIAATRVASRLPRISSPLHAGHLSSANLLTLASGALAGAPQLRSSKRAGEAQIKYADKIYRAANCEWSFRIISLQCQ
jgi:hypothetical protein